MKEEDELLRKCGTKNPFTVPEGYFENFGKGNLPFRTCHHYMATCETMDIYDSHVLRTHVERQSFCRTA